MQAQTLKEALRTLDPHRPLRTSGEIHEYYVDRSRNPVDAIALILQNTIEPQKVLLTGARGSGVSTEFFRLSEQLQKDFFIVHYSIKERFDFIDLTVADILLSLGLGIIRKALEYGIPISEHLQSEILNLGIGIPGMKIGKHPGISPWIQVGVAKVPANNLSLEQTRQQVSSRVYDLLESINELAFEIHSLTNKQVLIFLEDIDKIQTDTVTQLFLNHSDLLLLPQISIIYSFPFPLCHSPAFSQIRMRFLNFFKFPNFTPKRMDETPYEPEIDKLAAILTQRIKKELLPWETLKQLALLSGGIPGQLINLAKHSVLEAILLNEPVVTLKAVERATTTQRINYQSMLTQQQLEFLSRIHQTKHFRIGEQHQFLLNSLAALVYENDERAWYEVNPVIIPLLG